MPRPTGARPILALLTDFGTRDPYVAAMKGVALGLHPELTILDLTHEIAPHDVAEGSRHLVDVVPYLPANTAVVGVVDPGVGSDRRPIAARAGDHWFLGPDNGLFAGVFARTPPELIVAITDPRYVRVPVSRTFEGRDRFAPAAAWILSGVPLAALGPVVTDPMGLPAAADDGPGGDGILRGRLVRADRFGNVITSLDRVVFDVFASGARVEIRVDGAPVRLVDTYAEIGDGEVAALFGSAGWLELAARSAPALGRPGLAIGDAIEVILSPP